MSTSYEKTGRTGQKARTRQALVTAARELLADGISATVERTADRAGISRTTAYRYFANQQDLLRSTYPELQTPGVVELDSPDPVVRVDAVARAIGRQVAENQAVLRAQLRLSLDPAVRSEDLPLRKGRAIGWYEDALAPLADRLGPAGVRRLAVTLRSAAGLEAFVWLVDVAGQTPDEACATMRWTARAIVRGAVEDAG